MFARRKPTTSVAGERLDSTRVGARARVAVLAAVPLIVLAAGSPGLASAAVGDGRNQIADVNGDGRADRIAWNDASAWVEQSTLLGFSGPQQWATGAAFYGTRANLAGDVNGDGRADLIGWNDASAWVELSSGSGFSSPRQWSVVTPFYGSTSLGPGGTGSNRASPDGRFCDGFYAHPHGQQGHQCASMHFRFLAGVGGWGRDGPVCVNGLDTAGRPVATWSCVSAGVGVLMVFDGKRELMGIIRNMSNGYNLLSGREY